MADTATRGRGRGRGGGAARGGKPNSGGGNNASRGGGGRGGGRGSRGGGGSRGGKPGGEGKKTPQFPGGPTVPKKENILDMSKYIDKRIQVKFVGGREVTGILQGYDPLLNIVLDDTEEQLMSQGNVIGSRKLGLVVGRGTGVIVVAPVEGCEEIENPFEQS